MIAGGKLLKKAVALLLLNFKRFKSINDIIGNGIGNELLRRVVHRLPEIACPLPHGYPFFSNDLRHSTKKQNSRELSGNQ
jgi:hypothetical protein